MQIFRSQRESATGRDADGESSERSDATGRRVDRSRSEARGQTTFDFGVGMSLFLVSLIFVLLFVPGMLGPFTDGTQDEMPAANRVADDLATRLLGDADAPYVLDANCTTQFFESGAPSGCEFDGTTTTERVGVRNLTGVNVTVYGNTTGGVENGVLCWYDGTGRVVERSGPDCGSTSDDVVFQRGPNPTVDSSRTVSARRVALLDGHDVTVQVVMW